MSKDIFTGYEGPEKKLKDSEEEEIPQVKWKVTLVPYMYSAGVRGQIYRKVIYKDTIGEVEFLAVGLVMLDNEHELNDFKRRLESGD